MKVRIGKESALRCQVCGQEDFEERKAQLNTPGLSFLNLDWLNRSAVCYVCRHCGYVHWFLTKDSKVKPTAR